MAWTSKREQRWTVYAYSLLGFSLVSFLAVYCSNESRARCRSIPADMAGVVPHLSFNTAVSFMTNTNWQSYGGETTMSHLTQMTGLAVQNFVSAAAGMAVMAALIRGIARRRARTLGNFWVDLTRSTVRILLPLSLVVAVLLVSQGVIQNFHGHTEVTTVEGTTQVIAGGPAASQIAIKQLGTNGGGFFNVNSAHPFENSTPFNNFLEMFSIVIIPFALAFTFGHMVKDRRQGRAVFAIMLAIWSVMSIGAMALEGNGNSRLTDLGADQSVSTELAGGGNLEGKEVRFGTGASGLWAATTTGTSNGSVNSMHDSYTPLGGGVASTHMMLGEVSPGGVGVGLNGLLIMAILSVFLAGLMVGRTPEYLGKKIQAAEMKMVVLYLLAMPLALLGFAAASVVLDSAQTTNNPGPHGLTRDPLRLHVGRQQQRLSVRRSDDCDAVVRHDPRHRHARRALLPDHSRPRHRRITRPQADRAGVRRAPSRRTRRCSAASSSASSPSLPASPSSRPWPWAPSSSN